MHFSYQIISLASLATGAWAAPAAAKCKPPARPSSSSSSAATATATATATNTAAPTQVAAVTPTLPTTGSTDLPGASANLTLKHIAVGHGIQNYTCTSTNATAVNVGALAVLWDVTPLYPGTEGTGLSTDVFANLTSTVLWDHAIPLNLMEPSAAGPPTRGAVATNTFTEASYQAVASSPYPSPPADLGVTGDLGDISAKYLGVHYFDGASAPTFNLEASTAEGGPLFFSGAKVGDVKAPAAADKGLLATSAVDWLELADNGRGLSSGVVNVYRVVTAGGAAEACSVSGANAEGEVLSVPYVAQYWFYG